MTERTKNIYHNEDGSSKNGRRGSTARQDAQDDMAGTYFKQIKAFPLLSFEEEQTLAKRIKEGDTAARHTLVNSNLRLVVKIAQLYTARDVSFMDLIQEGNLGLMHAAEKFDTRKNVRF